MRYLLDTADCAAIRQAFACYPLEGVTTNPSILARERTDPAALLREIRAVIGPERMLHVQTTERTAEAIAEEGRQLQSFLGGNFYLKIPVTEEGLRATRMLTAEGIPVTATAVFTPMQAMLAARAGASFAAPYVNRLDQLAGDGCAVAAEIAAGFDRYALNCQVLAASFKNVEQVRRAAAGGCHCVTVAPEILFALLRHPMTDSAVQTFDADWQSAFGDRHWTELLKEQ